MHGASIASASIVSSSTRLAAILFDIDGTLGFATCGGPRVAGWRRRSACCGGSADCSAVTDACHSTLADDDGRECRVACSYDPAAYRRRDAAPRP